MACRVHDWKVLESVETGSDHRYIRFNVSALPGTTNSLSRSRTGGGPRWALKHLDRDAFEEAAIVQAWVSAPEGTLNTETEAERIGASLVQMCDAAMPRAKAYVPKRSVYWWSAELAQQRETCVEVRRQYTRCRRRRMRNEEEEDRLHEEYLEACRTLKVSVACSKILAEETLLETLNNDPWGRPYKMVRRKLRPWAPPMTQSLHPQLLESVVATLFPDGANHVPPSMAPQEATEEEETPRVSEGQLRAAVLRLRAKNTAPGPDGVPGRALVMALGGPFEEHVRTLFTECFAQGRFPRRWKTGRLVLLKKEGRPTDSPSAYRPIVLLDEIGKLFERIVASHLIRHLVETGPNLSSNQFGFRQGRSTIDAIARVRALAEEAVDQGEVVLAVSLDIANAFNTLPWSTINEAMRYHGMPGYLRRLVQDYLSERYITYPAKEGWQTKRVSCGVPQGSVLGPLLWNIGYDWVLRGTTLRGVDLTCYADDTLVTARGCNYRDAAMLATAGTAQVVGKIRRLGLEVALSKSEVLCFHGPRRAPPHGSLLVVGGVSITVKSTMRYLGIVLDSRWSFKEHFKRLASKLVGAANALSRLLPNVSGPNAGCRRLYAGVVRSMALYGAPIWVDALTPHNKALLRRPQRVMAVRLIRGYRTISCEAACLLAGTPPWELEAQVLADVYWQVAELRDQGNPPLPEEVRRWRERSKSTLLQKWREMLEEPSAGHCTIEAVRPVIERWVGEKRKGALTFHLVQILTGHGCFGEYLYRVAGREPTSQCHSCGCAEDTAQHTLAVCPGWAEQRSQLVAVVGADLSLSAVVTSMVNSERSWQAVVSFCEEVMSRKEVAERTREDDVSSNPIRHRRTGRRRRAYARNLPP